MPNHVTSWVEIFSEDKKKIKDLKEKVIKPDAENHENGIKFDFNGIIPMPTSMNITSGSTTSMGMAAYSQKEFDSYSQYPWFEEKYPGVKTPAQLRKFLEKQGGDMNKQALKEGKIAVENLEKYGYATWYDWCNSKWGTKWNAYEARLLYQDHCTLAVEFQTAWASPIPLFEELEKRGFRVNCFWQDEDPSNEGTYGDPYSVFDIYHDVQVDYMGGRV